MGFFLQHHFVTASYSQLKSRTCILRMSVLPISLKMSSPATEKYISHLFLYLNFFHKWKYKVTSFYRVIFCFSCLSSTASNRTSLVLLIFHIAHWYTIATSQAKLQSVFLLLSAHTSYWAAARWFIREGFTIGQRKIISGCFSHPDKTISVVDTLAALPEPCYAHLKIEILLSKCQENFPWNQCFGSARRFCCAFLFNSVATVTFCPITGQGCVELIISISWEIWNRILCIRNICLYSETHWHVL